MSDWFDKDGKRLDMMAWASLLEDREYKRVAWDKYPGGYLSTVWLGLDHSHGGPPLIFESMDFPKNDHCARYSTLEDALEGHRLILEKLRALPRSEEEKAE